MFLCVHTRSANQSPYANVNVYYNTATWLETYSTEIMPVPDPGDWCVPDDVTSRLLKHLLILNK